MAFKIKFRQEGEGTASLTAVEMDLPEGLNLRQSVLAAKNLVAVKTREAEITTKGCLLDGLPNCRPTASCGGCVHNT